MRLEALLKQKNIDFAEHMHAKAYTAQDLAHEEHVSGFFVAKPVIVRAGDAYAMCVLSAPQHLDLRRVAEVLGVPDVRLATESEMVELFPECELGAEPPVGSLFNMKTIMDERLREDEQLVMQAGTHTKAIRMGREDWEQLCDPIVACIATGQ